MGRKFVYFVGGEGRGGEGRGEDLGRQRHNGGVCF
jgi:hypothetical protein